MITHTAILSGAALVGAALISLSQVAPPATPAQPRPAQPRPAQPTQPPPAQPTQPPPAQAAPVLAPTLETQLIRAPLPTVSVTFGSRVNAAAGEFLVTGPVRSTAVGMGGQVASFKNQDGVWTPMSAMWQLSLVQNRELVLQRNASGGNVFVTALERGRGIPHSLAVFENDGARWVQQPTLEVPRGLTRTGFGGTISTDGKRIVTGCVDLRSVVGKEPPISNPEVFVFAKTEKGWESEALILPPPKPGSQREAMWFGISVCVDGDTLAIGSPAMQPARVHEAFQRSGEPIVFVMRRHAEHGWQVEAEVTGAAQDAGLGFGNVVALEGDLLAVTASAMLPSQTTNRVLLFRRNGTEWKFVNELKPAEGIVPGRGYGLRMLINKGRVIICDYTASTVDQPGIGGTGMVLVFEARDGAWVNTVRLQPKEKGAPGQFGKDVAAMWPWVAVGHVKNERIGIDYGGAYLFKLE